MNILDLIAGLLVFHFVTFSLYIAVVLVCLEDGKNGKDIIEQHIDGEGERQQTRTEIPDE